MIEFDLGIAEQLTQVTTTSSVQVRVGTSNSDLVIASIIQPLMQNFGMGGVYITASQTAPNVIEMMNTIGQVGHGIAIAQGIREAAPVVIGAMRTAGSLLPMLL